MASFVIQHEALPFASHLEARDSEGQVRTVFAAGEPVIFVYRFSNGGGATLPVYTDCGFPRVCVYDWKGATVWLPFFMCPQMDMGPTPVRPCSELEFGLVWYQNDWIYEDRSVPRGTYTVQACTYGEFPGLESPPQIKIRLR